MNVSLLFDTSVWIDFLNKKTTPEANLLVHYIEEDKQVLLTPTILQEILQGIRDDFKYRQIKEMLSYFTILELPPIRAAVGAADLYRSLRKKGATIGKVMIVLSLTMPWNFPVQWYILILTSIK